MTIHTSMFRKGLVLVVFILFVGVSVNACNCTENKHNNFNNESTTNKKLTSKDIAELQRQAELEGWTFNIGANSATKRSLDELCGLRLPEDWWVNANFDTCMPRGSLPDKFDWRDVDGVDFTTPIKDQGSCGSCWAFGTVGPLECNIKYKEGLEVDLSEQWLVSCNQDGWGCDGGWWAHDYHMWKTDFCGDTGAVLESDFPYVAYDAPCNCPYPHEYLIEDWAFIGSEHGIPAVDSIKQAIMDYGPVSSAVYVNSAFQAYSSGIFDGCSSGQVNHGVVLVGWDDNQGDNGVWFLRNSWGTGWGEDGYMRIPYDCSNIGYSACYVDYGSVGDKTLEVTINRITNDPEQGDYDQIDEWWDIRGGINPEWYYRVVVEDLGETRSQYNYNRDLDDWWIFQWISQHTWNPQQVHTFFIDDTKVEITIKLMDDDVISGDDLADVSAYSGGGVDDGIPEKRAAIYHGTYDLATNTLTGDAVTEDDGYFVTQGDGINNAKVWFKIIDNYEPEPDLESKGSLSWTGVTPASTVTKSISIENIGQTGSELSWEVVNWPGWGTWVFKPKSGDGLTPEDEEVTVEVKVLVPNQLNKDFSGEVKVVNIKNSSDYEIIPVSLTTQKTRTVYHPLFIRFLEIFPMLERLLSLIRLR